MLQFALMPVVIAAGLVGEPWPDSVSRVLSVVGAVLAVCGVVVVFLAARALGRSLTPYPRPLDRGDIVEAGPYRLVRHPIYSGGVLFFAGFSLAFSPWALAVAVVLAVVWGLKARVEERFLQQRYPGYDRYMASTRYRAVSLRLLTRGR